MAQRQISPERKALYYGGMILSGIGLLIFLSIFLTAASNFGDSSGNFENRIHDTLRDRGFQDIHVQIEGFQKTHDTFSSRAQSMMIRAISGIVLMGIGGFLTKLGAKGPAGAGLILDPEQARRDVEPWSRATGGMIKDGLDEAGINLGTVLGAKATEPGDTDTNFADKIRELHRLYEEGLLSQEEYERAKRELLDKI